jgi:hypothetical protein
MRFKHAVSVVMLCLFGLVALNSFAQECPSNWKTLHPEWIWCDDFETNKTASYFESTGPFNRTAGVGFNGSYGMQSTWTSGLADGGSLKLAFGLTPQGSGLVPPAGVDTTTKFREIYYRVYLKTQIGWVNPNSPNNSKLVRAMVMSSSDWSQAMVAHVWSDETNNAFLMSDPVNCVSGSTVRCAGYNDFADFIWLGGSRGTTAIFVAPNLGTWKCIEHHVKLNDAGQSNGVSEFWIDDHLEASRADLDFVGSYSAFGINSVFFENYINNGSPQAQSRYWDNIVVSTKRVGCNPGSNTLPPPENLRIR